MSSLAAVSIDGVAYGMLLFLFAIGLSVTLGLMRFINLAHGVFAMAGGYVAVLLMNQAGLAFGVAMAAAAGLAGATGILLERGVIRYLYAVSPLQQVLFTIGLAFTASALATIAFGPQQQLVRLPAWVAGRLSLFGLGISGYRLLLIGVGLAVAVGLVVLFDHTLFGARIRAAVDNRGTAEGVGIRVERLFALAFGLGSALAGLGGALSIELLGLDPTFPFKYLTLSLMVVAMGGAGSIIGSLFAALGLGIIDALFKYFMPEAGAFVIFGLLVAVLVVFPAGLKGRTA
jgi:branched-chain amino acid transport system permease protein